MHALWNSISVSDRKKLTARWLGTWLPPFRNWWLKESISSETIDVPMNILQNWNSSRRSGTTNENTDNHRRYESRPAGSLAALSLWFQGDVLSVTAADRKDQHGGTACISISESTWQYRVGAAGEILTILRGKWHSVFDRYVSSEQGIIKWFFFKWFFFNN